MIDDAARWETHLCLKACRLAQKKLHLLPFIFFFFSISKKLKPDKVVVVNHLTLVVLFSGSPMPAPASFLSVNFFLKRKSVNMAGKLLEVGCRMLGAFGQESRFTTCQ